jgi:hypothetical protein
MRSRDPRMSDQVYWDQQIPEIAARSTARQAGANPYVADRPYRLPPIDNEGVSYEDAYLQWQEAYGADLRPRPSAADGLAKQLVTAIGQATKRWGVTAYSVSAGDTAPAAAVLVYDASDIDVTKIPPRGWLVGKTFCRKFISGLIGAGTVGKTTLRYLQYLAAATGRPLSGEYVHVRSRVLICCFEDDLDEIRRRIGAAMLHHGVMPEEIKGWVRYCCPRGLKLLQSSRRGPAAVGGLYGELRRIVAEHKIDILGLDPFVKAAGVEENDNNLIDQVCTMLSGIADEFDCAVDINSHARKGDATPGDAERDRGASAKKDAGRLMHTITPMSVDEAALFGISPKDQPAFVRVDDAKVNIVPRLNEAMWFRLVGVPLGNATELYPNCDNVQTAERWQPRDPFAKLDKAMIERILTQIEAGPYADGRFSPSPNATDRAAWPIVQRCCPEFTEQQAKYVIKTWLRTGVLLKRDHEDPRDRHPHVSLFVGKRPGDTWEG